MTYGLTMKNGSDRLCLAVGMGTLLFGCGSGRGAVDGRIIDAEHDSVPVPGAFVVIKRERGVGVWEGTVCDAQELSSSDNQGHFHFKSWRPPIRSIWDVMLPSQYFIGITVYKQGFIGSENIVINDQYRGVVVLEGHDLTSEAELEHIRQVGASLFSCDACAGN